MLSTHVGSKGSKIADTYLRKFNLVKLLMVAALACIASHAVHIRKILWWEIELSRTWDQKLMDFENNTRLDNTGPKWLEIVKHGK